MITADELSNDDLDRFIESKLFQKYYAYRSLTQGIQALEQDDALYDSLVSGVMRRQNSVTTRGTVQEIMTALVEEVEDNTDFIEPAEDDE